MIAILEGGIFDGKRGKVAEIEKTICFPRWHCSKYPGKGYKVKNEYILTTAINLGEPIFFYRFIGIDERSLSSLAFQQSNGANCQLSNALQQNYQSQLGPSSFFDGLIGQSVFR